MGLAAGKAYVLSGHGSWFLRALCCGRVLGEIALWLPELGAAGAYALLAWPC